MSYQEHKSADQWLQKRIYSLKKNHCACVWIFTDVDFTDYGDGSVGAEGLCWLLPFC